MTAVLAALAPTLILLASLAQNPNDRLPACCRRDGKHHCAMMDMATTVSNEVQVSALSPVCPFRSEARSIPVVASYLPKAAANFFSEVQSHPAIHAQTHASYRISEERTHQKRGPPATFTS
jgi:hypothetical protein